MDRHDYYFGEVVTESELDEGFDFAEQGDWDQVADLGLHGISYPRYDVAGSWPTLPVSWTARQDSPTSFNVIVDTGFAHDKDGKRLAVDPPTNVLVDCSQDYLGNSNSVAVGKERWISIFLKFARNNSDLRTDDDGNPVYFLQEEDYTLEVRQGPEETAPATTKPTLDAAAILVCDIIIRNGTPPIVNADISTLRTEALVNLDLSGLLGGSASLFARNLEEALYGLTDEITSATALWDGEYLRRDGTNTMTGNLNPDTADSRTIGATARWLLANLQGLYVRPGATNIAEIEGLVAHFDTVGHMDEMAMARDFINSEDQLMIDSMGRLTELYFHEHEDFLWTSDAIGLGWTDRVDARFDVGISGPTGARSFNDGLYAKDVPCGFIRLHTEANLDNAFVRGVSWVGLSDKGFMVDYGFLLKNLSSTSVIVFGMNSQSTGIVFEWIYDPTGYTNPGTPNSNWWTYYEDFTNAAVWNDESIAAAASTYIRLSVAFEINNSGQLLARFYKDRTLVRTLNLTTLGGTYESLADADTWDFYCGVRGTAANTDDVLIDYYDVKSRRDFHT